MSIERASEIRRVALLAFCLLSSTQFVCGEPPPTSVEAKLLEKGWDFHRGDIKIEWIGINVTSRPNADPKPITVIGRGDDGNKNDDDLPAIGQLRALQVVMDFSGAFDDRYLDALNVKAPLRALVIPGSKITDAGLKRLDDFPGLEHLDLAFCAIGDESISTLSRFK